MEPNIPREVQYLISNYDHESILSLPLEHILVLNWAYLLRENFGYKVTDDMQCMDLIHMYIDACQKKKYIFCGLYRSYIHMRNGLARIQLENHENIWDRVLSVTEPIDIEDIVGSYNKMFIKYSLRDKGEYGCILATGDNTYGQLGIGNNVTQTDY